MEKQTKNKNKRHGLFLPLVIGAFIGVALSFFNFGEFLENNWSISKTLILLLSIYISMFISINIHEFGHFAFGRMLGYRLISYRVSFFAWNNENGKMKFSIMKNKGYGGLCAMIPPKDQLPDHISILFYGGGIILNILSGLLFLLSIFLIPNISEYENIFIVTLGIMSLILGVINFMPFMSANHPTDGKIIWSLILKKPFAKKHIEANKILSQLSSGIRPRDAEIMPFENTDEMELFDLMSLVHHYFKALDSNNLESMLKYVGLLEDNIDKFPYSVLPSIYYELCYMGCIMGKEDQAKMYYEKGGKILTNDKDANGLRVKAYFEYYINKDIKSALVLCQSGLEVADKFPIRGQGLMEKDLLYSLKEMIESK